MTLKHEGEHTDPDDDGDDGDDSALEEVEWSGFHSPDLADAIGAMIHDDDPTDLDWVPSRMRKELVRREKVWIDSLKECFRILKLPAERPNEYKKGPSVMSKSARTQRHYQKAFRGQRMLTGFSLGLLINHGDLSINAYRNGLTSGWAAAWVVRKQKGHQSVSEKAMKALEEVKGKAG
ncbi:hypothetical protein F5887DRAFT_1088617 [Amanita rubescens]|nr:hypothetical protein F5887DRAFT_1088617 [Amanita rubescens]